MNTNLKANIGYGLAFGMYFSTYCIIASFNSVYLLAHNYTNTEIGILIAVGNLVSVAMQPFLANLADRSKRLSVFQISIIVSILMMLFAVFTLVLHGRSVVLFVAYLILFAVHASLQPLLNSMDQTLAVRGVSVDYGICRSMGSLFYSGTSALASMIVVRAGVGALPIVTEIGTVLMILGLLVLHTVYRGAVTDSADGSRQALKAAPDITMGEFISRHKLFLVLTVGVFLLYFDHQIINFFMLQIFRNVGGDASQMGMYYSIMTLLEIPTMVAFTWLTRRFSTSFLLKLATIGFVLRAVTMVLAGNTLLMMLTLAVHPIGFPLFLPTMVRYIDEIMDRREAVRGQSLYIIVVTISGVIASATGGVILDRLGVSPLLWICVITCVLGAALVLPLINRVREESK